MKFITRLCVCYVAAKILRYLDGVKWLSPSGVQCRTVKIVNRLPVVHELISKRAGISAGEYFHALRNRKPVSNGDLSDASFLAWRACNNR